MNKKGSSSIWYGVLVLLACGVCGILWNVLLGESSVNGAVCTTVVGLVGAVVSVILWEMIMGDKNGKL